MPVHRAGFVNIIGKPNVGKSTLMNALVGEKLSIVTSKAQTTRHRIIGIVNGDDFQIVFSDTPGIIKPAYKMQQGMISLVKTAITDADVLLYMTDMHESKLPEKGIIEKLQTSKIPLIALVNKIDLSVQEAVEDKISSMKKLFPDAKVLPVSALHSFNLGQLLELIKDFLPEAPAFYPDGTLTDRPERFFISEIIREKIFLAYKQEVPYCCEVCIDEFKETDKIIHIRALIYVGRDS
ncbi:MAG: GTPase Era, partial [Flavobacteriales bacterium]